VSWYWDESAPNAHYFVNQAGGVLHGLRLSFDSTLNDPLSACPPGGCSGLWAFQQVIGPTS
jgi:hypothetical protein